MKISNGIVFQAHFRNNSDLKGLNHCFSELVSYLELMWIINIWIVSLGATNES